MKVNKATHYQLEGHKANSQANTLRCVEFVMRKFNNQFGARTLDSVSMKDVLTFLTKLTSNRKQATQRNRLSSFYNFTISTSQPELKNPCCNSVIKTDIQATTTDPVTENGQGYS